MADFCIVKLKPKKMLILNQEPGNYSSISTDLTFSRDARQAFGPSRLNLTFKCTDYYLVIVDLLDVIFLPHVKGCPM